MDKLIGREKEIAELKRCVDSSRSEFIVVYGRRRVGKTFLVRKFFDDTYSFHYVGAHQASTRIQLDNFAKALERYGGKKVPRLNDWSDAFAHLQTHLESLDNTKRKVVFIDEMPWIDNKQSRFVEAFEYFWNSWAMGRDDIVLVVCGSATSWMVDNLEENQGGLHGRITSRIYLRPFTLHECQLYLRSRRFDWDEYQIMQNYMVMGGVPYYMSLLTPELSLQQNIDKLYFERGGMLRTEFDELYNALFTQADKYIVVVRLLAQHREGMLRSEIEHHTGLSGGTLTRILRNLERCDFVYGYTQLGKKVKGVIYKLVDFYTLFYCKFIDGNRSGDEQYWMHNFQSRSVSVWEGLSFELVCLMHIWQIKHALGISGIATEVAAWRSAPTNGQRGTQIDLVIKRVDKIVHLCEMKFSETPYAIKSDYVEKLSQRKQLFCDQMGIKRGVVHTFVTPWGLNRGKHNSVVHSEVTARELFTM